MRLEHRNTVSTFYLNIYFHLDINALYDHVKDGLHLCYLLNINVSFNKSCNNMS